MTIVDVNLLIYAVNADFPEHVNVRKWLDGLLEREEPIGLPWLVLIAFTRITTSSRAMTHPWALDESLQQVAAWLALPGVTVPQPGPDHARCFTEQCRSANAVGNLVTDAHLAALAIERDCELALNDGDFARFPGLRWINPLVQL